jgi:hypothetical protein
MATLDTAILSQMQAHLVETVDGGVSVSSGLWTVAEWVEALDQAQLWLVRETMAITNYAELDPASPSLHRIPLPSDWLITRRVVWWGSSNATSKELPRGSVWSASLLASDWETTDSLSPMAYSDFETQQLILELLPASSDATGYALITYIPRTPALSNSGVAISFPDACTPTIKWRALAILLGKEGRGMDLARAGLAQQFADEGKMALVALMKGWA